MNGIGAGAIEGFGSSTIFATMAVQNSTASSDRLAKRTCGVQAERTWSNETHRVDDANSAGMAENGTISHPQSVDSRQPSRPHDQGHDSRETDQVWTCLELARIIPHRLEPTCTVRSISPITETLTVLMNTVNSFQNHRRTENWGYLGTTSETEIDDSTQHSTSNMRDDTNNAPTKEAIENEVAHRWRVLAMTSLSLANDIAASDAKLAAANARKRLQTTASLKPSWWTLRTR